jgi:AraC-like DNA-binding protein
MNVPLAVEESIFSSRLVHLAEHHCPSPSPSFVDTHSIVFPLTSAAIVRNGVPGLELATTVTLHNRGEVVSRENSASAWLTLDPSLLFEILGSDADGRRPFSVDQLPLSAPLSLRQRALFHFARRHGHADPLAVQEESIAIAEEVANNIRGAKPERVSLAVVERARAALAVQFASTVSLAELARQLDVSPAYLSRAFRAATGETLHAFREDLRLRRSLDLLPDARGDFTRVALELGYSSHSHFSSRFRRHFGMTPVQFVDRTTGAGFRRAVEEVTHRTAADDGRYACT